MIGTLDKLDFAKILHSHLSPSRPIQSREHLYGRDAQFNEIEQALYSPGRHVFIYGDRGVGKTSLAQTAAFTHQSSDNDPILVACGRNSTFTDVMRNVFTRMIPQPSNKKSKSTIKGRLSLPGITLEAQKSFESGEVPEVHGVNDTITILKALAAEYSGKTIVVVDEFDLIENPAEKSHFADFIKQMGDQAVPVQFIFCGIGESLDDLLGAHASCYRYLANVELPRLYFDARWEIIDESAEALGVQMDENSRFRIAAISDGFPHYIHLICEKLYWEIFNASKVCEKPTSDHYSAAIRMAIKGIQQQLKRAYDRATMKDSDDYHEILWAAADHQNLIRRGEQIYQSYQRIKGLRGGPVLEKKGFSYRIAKLRSESCGRILANSRRGWYHFRESIIRGYVRLRAEAEGIELAIEHSDEPERRVTARARKGLGPRPGWRRMYTKFRRPGER
ncbi:MAG: ATP-binding protein [Deltaproteobacteria bacterium]|nr:ATP-binding protein [Deltaproteobacteria bacterium]